MFIKWRETKEKRVSKNINIIEIREKISNKKNWTELKPKKIIIYLPCI